MQNFIILLLTTSITMSIITVLYLALIPFLLKRYAVKTCYYAWLVIIIGLIFPFRMNLDDAIIHINLPNESTISNTIIDKNIIKQTEQINTQPNYTNKVNIDTNTDSKIITINEQPIKHSIEKSSVSSNISLTSVIFTSWLLGVIILITTHIFKHYRFVKLTNRWKENVKDESILREFQQIKIEMNLSKPIDIYICPNIYSPMMLGIVSPKILLPDTEFSEEELRFILKHELVHFNRKDLWYKLLVLVAVTIHWFNPIIALSVKSIESLCEISCDAEVVKNETPDSRLNYSKTILHAIKYKSIIKTTLSTNFYGRKKVMKKRISTIMDSNRKKAGIVIIGVIAILTVSTGIIISINKSKDDIPTTIQDNTITTTSETESTETTTIQTTNSSKTKTDSSTTIKATETITETISDETTITEATESTTTEAYIPQDTSEPEINENYISRYPNVEVISDNIYGTKREDAVSVMEAVDICVDAISKIYNIDVQNSTVEITYYSTEYAAPYSTEMYYADINNTYFCEINAVTGEIYSTKNPYSGSNEDYTKGFEYDDNSNEYNIEYADGTKVTSPASLEELDKTTDLFTPAIELVQNNLSQKTVVSAKTANWRTSDMHTNSIAVQMNDGSVYVVELGVRSKKVYSVQYFSDAEALASFDWSK